MPVPVTIGGSTLQIPEYGEQNWGPSVTTILQQLASLTFQRDSSAFTLQAEPDFGGSYGLKALYLKSRTGTVSTTGLVRAANNTAGVAWRNAANTDNLELTASASDQLQFGGRDLLPFVDVRYFGAVGDNATVNTTRLQSAIDYAVSSGSRTVMVPEGTYLSGALTVTSSLRFIGPGTIKHTASTVGNLISISGTSTVAVFDGPTIDGNQANQTTTSENRSIMFTAVGTSSAPAALVCEGAVFKNGCQADISVYTDNTRSTNEYVMIRGCRFLGGKEGTTEAYDPRFIDIRSPVNYVIVGNLLDRLAAPSAYGRAGVVVYDGHSTDEGARGTIASNTLVYCGRSQANSTLGAIDVYSRGRATSITGNTLISPVGRGIQCKADMKTLSVSGNTVEGLVGGSDGTMNAQITVNASTNTSANGTINIDGNTLLDSLWDAISVTGSNSTVSAYARTINITGNIVRNPLSTRRCIGLIRVDDANVSGNNLSGGNHAVYVDDAQTVVKVSANLCRDQAGSSIFLTNTNDGVNFSITENTVQGAGGRAIIVQSGGNGSVKGNDIFSPTQAAIEVSGTTGSVEVEDNLTVAATPFTNGGSNTSLHLGKNRFATAMSFSARELTIASGAVTAWADWHCIDTEGDAASDDLDTISSGFDGQVLTLRPANNSRTVVVKDGTGNIRLNGSGDYSMGHTNCTLTLIYSPSNTLWLEIGRGDNDT